MATLHYKLQQDLEHFVSIFLCYSALLTLPCRDNSSLFHDGNPPPQKKPFIYIIYFLDVTTVSSYMEVRHQSTLHVGAVRERMYMDAAKRTKRSTFHFSLEEESCDSDGGVA